MSPGLHLSDSISARGVRANDVDTLAARGWLAFPQAGAQQQEWRLAMESAAQESTRAPDALDAASIGTVSLIVSDLAGVRAFYEQTIGLRTLVSGDEVASLGVSETPLVELVGRPDAPPRPPGTTGLYHLALLVPSRPDLARAVQRVLDSGWRFTGASDHLVSEALYLNDPEGNGIEIYRDRPRDEWPRVNGGLRMASDPLDLDGLMRDLRQGADSDMPARTRLGHVHLQVADLRAAEDFYCGLLGFEVTVRGVPGALFIARDGYHHHIGLNTWAGEGAPAPPPGSRGLRWFEVVLPATEVARVVDRLSAAGAEARADAGAVLTADPSGNGVRIVSG